MTQIQELRDALRQFAAERDWEQFHSPKNLAMALNVEAGELLERFLWVSEEESRRPGERELERIAEEMADVFLYLVHLADKLNVDILDAAARKIRLNAEKYPADKARGNSRKYTEL